MTPATLQSLIALGESKTRRSRPRSLRTWDALRRKLVPSRSYLQTKFKRLTLLA